VPDPTLGGSPVGVPLLEEGKALYENGQLIADAGEFMTVLRSDPHNAEARQYLRVIVDTMRQNPAISASKMGTQDQALTRQSGGPGRNPPDAPAPLAPDHGPEGDSRREGRDPGERQPGVD